MKNVAILSHETVAAELSILGDWLNERELTFKRYYREQNWNPEEILEADFLIVLGSPNSTASLGKCLSKSNSFMLFLFWYYKDTKNYRELCLLRIIILNNQY